MKRRLRCRFPDCSKYVRGTRYYCRVSCRVDHTDVKRSKIKFAHKSNEKLTRLTQNNLTWIAGLLEGEGYFSLRVVQGNKKRNKYRVPAVACGMCDPDVVQRFAELVGASTYGPYMPSSISTIPVYRAVVSGQNAVRLMKLLYRHMGARRQAVIDSILSENSRLLKTGSRI